MLARYSLPEFDKIWSEENKYDTWLRVELAACGALEAEGVVPIRTSDAIEAKLPPGKFRSSDLLKIKKIEETTRHDFVAFLQFVENEIGPEARWLHYGLTSSDIVDTSFSLMLVRSHELVHVELRRLINALEDRVREFSHKPVPMIGRTHGMHAEPITFALVLARHLAEFKRNLTRLEFTKTDLAVGKLSGAVGTYAHFSQEAERNALKYLGLNPAIDSTQVIARDRYAAFFLELSLIAVAIERMAVTFRHLQRSEVDEMSEGFVSGQKGSSAMPHKKNPITSENLCGLSRYVRGLVTSVIENCVLWHERDISHSSVERFVAPDMTSTVGFMLRRAVSLVEGIHPNRNTMINTLEKSNWTSETLLLTLISAGMTRTEAHDTVQKAVNSTEKLSLVEVVLKDPRVKGLRLDKSKICDKCSIQYATRNVGDIINNIKEY